MESMDMHSAGLTERPLEIQPVPTIDPGEGDQGGGEDHIDFHHSGERKILSREQGGVFDGIRPEKPEGESDSDDTSFL